MRLIAALSPTQPWHRVLKRIEGKFGTSVVAVFNLLRDMAQLNLLLAVLLVCGVVIPSSLLARDEEYQTYGWMFSGNCSHKPDDMCSALSLEVNIEVSAGLHHPGSAVGCYWVGIGTV